MFSNEPVQATAQALHGLVSNAEWTGVPLSTCSTRPASTRTAKWLIAEGADSPALHRSVPVKKASTTRWSRSTRTASGCMPGNGYPMRLLLPGYEGNMNVKCLRRIKLIDAAGHELLRGANLFADPAGRQGLAVPFPPGGEVASSPIPSFGQTLEGAGLLRDLRRRLFRHRPHRQGHGLGRRRQELGARRRCRARCIRKAFTRFRMPWRWDGQPAVLQSRAWDEAGNVQPTARGVRRGARRDQETGDERRSAFPNQHYNSLTSWGVDGKGEIKHVYA